MVDWSFFVLTQKPENNHYTIILKFCLFNVQDEPEVTAVSRSGRIIKKSSKLLGFESSDIRK